MSKKVLVCGAGGFIGRNVAEYLAEHRKDLEVYGTYHTKIPFNNPSIQLIQADLKKEVDVQRAVEGKDVILQFAATSSGVKDTTLRPYIHVTDNAVMNSFIFRAAHENNVSHVVFPSCGAIYQSSETPLKEADLNPADELFPKYYGAGNTKIYLEKMAKFFSDLGRTKFTIVRHSNNYGPYDKFDLERSHVLGATVTKVMSASEGSAIKVWGTGEEERDLLYVSDLVDFVERAMEMQTTRFETVNVGCGYSIPVSHLVQKVIDASGKNLSIEYEPSKPTIKTKLALDSTKAREMFDWSPRISLEEGLRRTIDWYKSNIASVI